jgi:lipid A 3-O-deacylase
MRIGTSVATLFFAVVSVCLAPPASAQDAPQFMTRHSWELGVFSGGGIGLGKSDNTQFMYAGGRIGWVVTANHLHGWLRGNFEWAVDMMPLYAVLPPDAAVYGGSFKPAIWQWNFTSHKRVVPYAAAAGGVVFSHSNIPPGDTSYVNFTSQLVTGARIFVKQDRAIFFEDAIGHLSSASLGTHNPGYNGLIEFTIGFSWWKPRDGGLI